MTALKDRTRLTGVLTVFECRMQSAKCRMNFSRKGSGLLSKKLTEKEKLFCLLYAQGGDARGCAARAGFSLTPQRSAAKLLAKDEIRAEISKIENERKTVHAAARGLYRLAFGSVADALRLMLCGDELTAQDIEELDFFNVSEIKRPKGGGLEIKFFDRLKALEKLEKLGSCEENPQSSFVQALTEGAKLISEEDDVE